MSGISELTNFIQAAKDASQRDHIIFDAGKVTSKRFYIEDPTHTFVSEEQRAENAKTVRIYRETIINVFGKMRVDRICSKYNLNLEQMEKEGSPLLAKHVEMIGVGAADLRTKDLKIMGLGKLSWLTPSQIENRIKALDPVKYIGDLGSPRDLYGTPCEADAWWTHNPALMDQERLTLLKPEDLSKMDKRTFMERFSKAVVNHEMEEKMIVPAPAGKGKVDYYKVYRKITTGDGLVAYALKPISNTSSLKPMVVFRPSQAYIAGEDCVETWLNDLQLNVGEMGYDAAKDMLANLAKDPKFCRPKQKISVLGFSLGGTFSQRFTADNWQYISEMNVFNNPSVDDKTAIEFARTINALPRMKTPLKITIYRTSGDVCHFVGGKHLGWGITHPDVKVRLVEITPMIVTPFTLMQLHSTRFYDADSVNYIERTVKGYSLLTELDNRKRGVEVFLYEKARRIIGGHIFFGLISLLYKMTQVFSRHTGMLVFRNSKNPAQV